MKIGDKLRHFRTKKGISQETLAHLLGIERNSYLKMEHGKTNVNWERLEQIVKILEVDVWEFLTHGEKQIVYVNTDNNGQITNSGNINVYNQKEDLAEKYKALEIKLAVLEERNSRLEAENEFYKKILEGRNR